MSNELGILSRIRRDEQLFFINAVRITGVQSANIAYENNSQYLKFIGSQNDKLTVPNGPQQGQATVEALVVDSDPFIAHTGADGFNGYLLRGRQNHSGNFSFTSGYLTRYSNRCGLGQIPQSTANILIVGDIGRITSADDRVVSGHYDTISGGTSVYNIKVAGPGSIDLTLNDFNTNRVTSYELFMSIDRNPTYVLGKRTPTRVDINYPIVVDFFATYEVDNYDSMRLNNYPCTTKSGNLILQCRNYRNDVLIQEFRFSGMELIGETHQAGADANALVSTHYRTYLTRGES